MAANWLQTQQLPSGTSCDYNVICQMDGMLSKRLGHLPWNDDIDSMEHTWIEQPTGICAFLHEETQEAGVPRIITDLRTYHRDGHKECEEEVVKNTMFFGVYLAGNGDGVASVQVAGAAKMANTGNFSISRGEKVVAYVGKIPLLHEAHQDKPTTILSETIAAIFLQETEWKHHVFEIGTALESRNGGGVLSVALNQPMYKNK